MKKCSACEKPNPLSSHRCFIFGKGRSVNQTAKKPRTSELLYQRLLKEFPEYADEMAKSDARPTREYSKGMWSWSYWPYYWLCIGSAWPMGELIKKM